MMELQEFADKVGESAFLSVLGAVHGDTPAEDRVLVKCSNPEAKFSVHVSSILTGSWDALFSVLMGKRSPRIMTHMTRIVGYYSELHNWNRSKIAELHDRHRGDYEVKG